MPVVKFTTEGGEKAIYLCYRGIESQVLQESKGDSPLYTILRFSTENPEEWPTEEEWDAICKSSYMKNVYRVDLTSPSTTCTCHALIHTLPHLKVTHVIINRLGEEDTINLLSTSGLKHIQVDSCAVINHSHVVRALPASQLDFLLVRLSNGFDHEELCKQCPHLKIGVTGYSSEDWQYLWARYRHDEYKPILTLLSPDRVMQKSPLKKVPKDLKRVLASFLL